MTSERCGATDHRFAKFDDATIFCQRCGEQRVMDVQALIAQLPTITYLPCPHPHYPPYPVWSPTWRPDTWPTIIVTNGTGNVGSTVSDFNEAQTTYTVLS